MADAIANFVAFIPKRTSEFDSNLVFTSISLSRTHPWGEHERECSTSHPVVEIILTCIQNLLRTLTESQVGGNTFEPELRLLLTSVKEARVSVVAACIATSGLIAFAAAV